MASRCSTALVEPPSAITTVIAFSNASLVMIWRAVMPCASRSTTASPERCAKSSRRRSAAGGAAEPGSDMPSASAADGHGVGGVHAAAGALAGTDGALDPVDVLAGHLARHAGADGLERVDDRDVLLGAVRA